VGFVVDKVAPGQVFSEYFGFPYHSFIPPKFSILTITRDRYNKPESGRHAEWTQFGLHPPLCKLKKMFLVCGKETGRGKQLWRMQSVDIRE
jgi:hypothetical protein